MRKLAQSRAEKRQAEEVHVRQQEGGNYKENGNVKVENSPPPSPHTPSYAKRMKSSTPTRPFSPQTPSQPQQTASRGGKWLPVGFAKCELFSVNTKFAHENARCQSAVRKLKKSRMELDISDFLDIAEKAASSDEPLIRDLALGVSTMAAQLNIMHGKNNTQSSSDAPLPFHGQSGFSKTRAANKDNVIVLPSGRCFRMSEVVTIGAASHWTAEKFEKNLRSLLRFVFDKVAVADSLFACYASTPTSCKYLCVGDRFYSRMIEYIMEGFGIDSSNDDARALILCHTREVLGHKLSRVRAVFNEQDRFASELEAEDLKKTIAECDGLQLAPLDFRHDDSVDEHDVVERDAAAAPNKKTGDRFDYNYNDSCPLENHHDDDHNGEFDNEIIVS